MNDTASISERVIELGSSKGRGTIEYLKTTLGTDEAGVQWDNAVVGVIDWVPVRNLTIMSNRVL